MLRAKCQIGSDGLPAAAYSINSGHFRLPFSLAIFACKSQPLVNYKTENNRYKGIPLAISLSTK